MPSGTPQVARLIFFMQAFQKPVLAPHVWHNAVRTQERVYFIERNVDLQLFLFFFGNGQRPLTTLKIGLIEKKFTIFGAEFVR